MKYLVLTIFIASFFISSAQAQFAGGSGTEEDPWHVRTLQQLQTIGDEKHLDKHFLLVNDIDASEAAGWNQGKGFEPIGWRNSHSDRNPFTGSFDGNGFIISNLTIDRQDEDGVGLFGYVEDSTIKNVILEDISVKGANYVGGLMGRTRRGNIYKSDAVGMVSGDSFVGGLVGLLDQGILQKSFSHSEITGNELFAGGLVGANFYGTVHSSFSTGTVSGTQSAGGLIGYSDGGMVYGSWSSANVTGESQVGGLVGQHILVLIEPGSGKIEKSPVHESVEMNERKNKLNTSYRKVLSRNMDYFNEEISASYTFSNDYSISYGEIASSYATGEVSGAEETGGLAGVNAARINSSYWDLETTGQSEGVGKGNAGGINGLTTIQMNGQDAYLHMYRFDFDQTWQLTEGYPVPAWMDPGDAVGQPMVPIIIVDPDSHDFYLTVLDSTKSREFIIRNTGNIELNGEITLSSTDPNIFSIVRGGGLFSIGPDSSRIVEVSFRPDYDRTYEVRLTIHHNAPNTDSPREVNLTGTGIKELLVQAQLQKNYPNPFNRLTFIHYSFELSPPGEQVHVQLTVYDTLGRRVDELVNEVKRAGTYLAIWDASGFPSGMYIYRLVIGNDVQSRKIMLIK